MTKKKNLLGALVLSIVPGLGQMYNRQYIKGGIYLGVTVSILTFLGPWLVKKLYGLITLGQVARQDHSMFLMTEGTLALIIFVALLMYIIFVARDAYVVAKEREQGHHLNNIKETVELIFDKGFVYILLLPATVLVILMIVFPLIITVFISFTNYDLYHTPPARLIDWVGFKNYLNIFTVSIWRKTLFNVLFWTIIWTVLSTTCQITLGIVLAVIVNQPKVRCKKIIRTIFLLPWAIPAFLTILTFSSFFNDSFGAMNTQVLPFFDKLIPFVKVGTIPWKTSPFWTKTALIMIQTWLGFPYVFIITTGTLQSIPDDLYEAAEIDGATSLSKFKTITLPMIFFAMGPILVTQYTFNFNNFSLIYLFNAGGPPIPGSTAGGTDILISWIYKLTLDSKMYGIAASLTLLISIFVVTFATWRLLQSKSFKEEDMM